MTINLKLPDIQELKPHITVFGVGGGGSNAVNNMISAGLQGVDFVVANTDAQALSMSKCDRIIQMGVTITEGLGAGSQPEIGKAAAEEALDEITDHLSGAHMVFITAGMGGGTGTGAAPVVAKAGREQGILTVGVVTKPFQFEGRRRMQLAESGIEELQKYVDTLIVIPNQNLFRVATEATTFADAFGLADEVLFSGVACITDLMVKEGLINLDFADVRSVMQGRGKAMMGTGEATGERRALQAAEAAIANPLLDETSMRGAKGLLISITGGRDLTLFEVDEAATRIREEVDDEANIIVGATFDDNLEGKIRVSVVGTGVDIEAGFGNNDIANVITKSNQNSGDKPSYSVSKRPGASRILPMKALIGLDAVMKSDDNSGNNSGNNSGDNDGNDYGEDKNTVSRSHDSSMAMNDVTADIADHNVSPDGSEMSDDEELGDELLDSEDFTVNANNTGHEIDINEFPPVARKQYHSAKSQSVSENRPLSLLRKLANVGLARREEPVEEEPNSRIEPIIDNGDGYIQSQSHYDSGEQTHRSDFKQSNKSKVVISRRQLPQDDDPVAPNKSIKSNDDVDIPAFLRRHS